MTNESNFAPKYNKTNGLYEQIRDHTRIPQVLFKKSTDEGITIVYHFILDYNNFRCFLHVEVVIIHSPPLSHLNHTKLMNLNTAQSNQAQPYLSPSSLFLRVRCMLQYESNWLATSSQS